MNDFSRWQCPTYYSEVEFKTTPMENIFKFAEHQKVKGDCLSTPKVVKCVISKKDKKANKDRKSNGRGRRGKNSR